MKALKLSEEHLITRFEWINSMEVYPHLNMFYPLTLEETKHWYQKNITNRSRYDFVFEDSNELVSMTGLTNLDYENGLIEFYIFVGPGHQRKGYGIKTTAWTINYAFSKLNLNKIILYTNNFNSKANNLYENLGFKLEGNLRQHKFRDGKFIDRCLYGLLREDWILSKHFNMQISLEF